VIAAALRRAGRQRRIDATVAQLHAALREPDLRRRGGGPAAGAVDKLGFLFEQAGE
jgi:hypothetical protein